MSNEVNAFQLEKNVFERRVDQFELRRNYVSVLVLLQRIFSFS